MPPLCHGSRPASSRAVGHRPTGVRNLSFLMLGVSAALTMSACAERATGPTEQVVGQPAHIVALSSVSPCTIPGSTFLQFTVKWPCGQEVTLAGQTQLIRENLEGVVGAWNGAIRATGAGVPPTFVYRAPADSVTTVVTGPTTGTEFCGSWTPESNTFQVVSEADAACANNKNRAPLADLLTHEMAHYWGWAGGAHVGHFGGVAGVSDHCTLALPSTSGVNTAICHHNVEGGLAAYGLRSLSSSNFWATPFVVGASGASLPDTLSLVAGASVTLQPGSFTKERGGTVGGRWTVTTANTAIATTNGTVVSATGPGTTSLTVRPSEGSGYFLTSAFAASTRVVHVVVQGAPAAPLVVEDIQVNTGIPITSAGSHQWSAVVPSGSAPGIVYRWVFEYSYALPPDSVFIPARQLNEIASPWIGSLPFDGAPRTVWQSVPAGSYNIRVKVWPVRDSVIGAPIVRDFPVCTSTGGGGGGGDSLMASFESGATPPGTDAVAGCIP